jgi:hypothetical protein
MTPLLTKPARQIAVRRLLLTILAAEVYLYLPTVHNPIGPPIGHFQQLASSFLHGRLDVVVESDSALALNELIPSRDGRRLFCAYPPLPAVLLMPFVAIFGLAVKVDVACRVVSAVNVFLFDACIAGLVRQIGEQELRVSPRLALDLLFAFGTVTWHNADMGGDWHFAHAVALCAMLLALREFLGANRSWAVGGYVALALLTRPTAALACLFFVLPLARNREIRRLLLFGAVPGIALVLLGMYNRARFGDPFEFGYAHMILRGTGKLLMDQYGQFHPHYIPRNLFWHFLAPPWPLANGTFPWVGFDPRGLSLFISCPAAFYVFLAVRRHWRLPCVRDAVIGVAACLVPLLMYFNTGFSQFGPRFAMDYLPLLLVLIIAGMGTKPSRVAYALIALSIAIQTWGVMLHPLVSLPTWLAPGP